MSIIQPSPKIMLTWPQSDKYFQSVGFSITGGMAYLPALVVESRYLGSDFIYPTYRSVL